MSTVSAPPELPSQLSSLIHCLAPYQLKRDFRYSGWHDWVGRVLQVYLNSNCIGEKSAVFMDDAGHAMTQLVDDKLMAVREDISDQK